MKKKKKNNKNPTKFQNEKPNIFGDNDPFVPTNSTLKIFEIRG